MADRLGRKNEGLYRPGPRAKPCGMTRNCSMISIIRSAGNSAPALRRISVTVKSGAVELGGHVDLVGKHGRVRTAPMPTWLKVSIEAWTSTARLTNGRVPLGSSRLVPSFSLTAVKRNFLLGTNRNFSLGRDRRMSAQSALAANLI